MCKVLNCKKYRKGDVEYCKECQKWVDWEHEHMLEQGVIKNESDDM